MERNVLRTYSGALAAVCTSARNVERADDVEHLFFKAVGDSLVFNTGVRVAEHALFTGTSGADITASIATDALGKLGLPESVSFVSAHSLKTCNLVKSCGSENLALVAEKLVVRNVVLTLTNCASVLKNVSESNFNGSILVDGGNSDAR